MKKKIKKFTKFNKANSKQIKFYAKQLVFAFFQIKETEKTLIQNNSILETGESP